MDLMNTIIRSTKLNNATAEMLKRPNQSYNLVSGKVFHTGCQNVNFCKYVSSSCFLTDNASKSVALGYVIMMQYVIMSFLFHLVKVRANECFY